MVFKFANVIINCSYEQHLLPILCQRFFTLYMARVPLTVDEAQFTAVYGVSDKFFDYNSPLFKKMKRFLSEAEQHDKQLSLEEEDEIKKQFLANRSR